MPVVSFTFGTPPADVVARMHAVGTHVSVMVTDPDEAAAAAAVGADSLVVQGPDAGGHRGTHAVDKSPDTRELDQLLEDVRSVTALPLVAAGGISTAERVVELLARGAVAVQVGTALLLTPECGASAAHKEALRSRAYPGTTLTRAFSGRYARGLTNRFILEHDRTAPAAYPELNQLTRPCARRRRPPATRAACRCGPGPGSVTSARRPPPRSSWGSGRAASTAPPARQRGHGPSGPWPR